MVSSAENSIGTVASTRPAPTSLAVDEERDVAALAEAATVVGELHPHLVLPAGIVPVAIDLEPLQAEEVVAVRRLAVRDVEREAAERAALGDDHAFGAAVGHDDLGRDGMRLVLEVDDRVLRQPPHAAEEHLRVAAHELRPPGEVGVEPLDAAVVEREDVVLRRLDQEEPLQLAELVGLVGGEVVRLRPVVRAVQLPDVVVESGASRSPPTGVLCRVTAVQPSW